MESPEQTPSRRGARRLVVASMLLASSGLGGCIANSSNPVASIAAAQASGREARIELDLSNPGGRNLVVEEVEYQLAHGETGLPVAEGSWKGTLPLDAGRTSRLPLRIAFDVEPLEPDSRKLHLNGTLHFKDRTGFLGLRFMDLTTTSFQIETEAQPLEDGSIRCGPSPDASAMRRAETKP